MPLDNNRISPDRIGFSRNLSRWEINRLLKDRDLKVLQTAEPVEAKTLRRLNESFFSIRPEVEFRVYGFSSMGCDLHFLSLMTNVQYLSADSLLKASGIESIIALSKLKGLRIGIFNLEDLSFLNGVPDGIETLSIGTTKSKKPDLAPLSRFKRLRTIYLEGQRKNIEVLSELPDLETVTLRSITLPGLDFLKPLEKMWSLDIKLGGTKNLTALEGMAHLKYLELWQIMGLTDIEVVSTLKGLQWLFLQSLSRVTSLPDFRDLKKLRRITLETMKGLKDVSALEDAPVLNEYFHIAANNLQPQDYLPLLKNRTVKSIRIGFGSDSKNNAFIDLMNEFGKAPGEFHRFEFVD